jgi:predicted nucleotidyltransferase
VPELDIQGILERLGDAGGNWVLQTRLGRFDVMQWLGDAELWGMLSPQAVEVDIDGLPVKVAGYDDLVVLKRQAARPSDLEDLERLRQARGE